MPSELTARQNEVLEYISANLSLCGPTVREIGNAMGISSPNGVMCHLKALEQKGCIERVESKSRGIRLLDTSNLDPYGTEIQLGSQRWLLMKAQDA